jgi:NDP-sugar pyrophosphorylase family protein
MKAMLFAAGLGTRLKPFTDHMPKALVAVNGQSLLEHNIRYLQRFGITDVIINVHHFASLVEEVVRTNNGFGSNVTISDERTELLETGGGLKKAASFFEGERDLVVMNVDVLTDLDLGKMIASHQSNAAIATLAVMKRDSTRQLLFNHDMRLCGWTNYKTGDEKISVPDQELFPFAFSGIQVLSQSLLAAIPFEGKFSMIDVYLYFAKNDLLQGYDHTGGIFIDVGKPGSIEQAEELFKK